MYLNSQSNFSSQIQMVNSFTHSFEVDDHDEELRNFLKRIVGTAHLRLTKKIEDEKIDFDIYEIVTTMVKIDKPYLRKYLLEINPNHLTDDDLTSFNSVINSLMSDSSI